MKMIYIPVVFSPEESGYSAFVPDLDGCFSQGETLDETVEMVCEAIGLYLEDVKELPSFSHPSALRCEEGQFIMAVPFDRLAYERRHSTKSVKKTLTIPSWLNEAAEEAHLNFSGILQSALKQQLDIKD